LLLGAVIGNIVGSVREWNNIRRKDFVPLLLLPTAPFASSQ